MVDHMEHAQAIKGKYNILLVTSLYFFISRGVGGIHTCYQDTWLNKFLAMGCWIWQRFSATILEMENEIKKERTLVCRAELIKTNTEHQMEVMAVNMVHHASTLHPYFSFLHNYIIVVGFFHSIFSIFFLQAEAYSLFSMQIGWTTKQAKNLVCCVIRILCS